MLKQLSFSAHVCRPVTHSSTSAKCGRPSKILAIYRIPNMLVNSEISICDGTLRMLTLAAAPVDCQSVGVDGTGAVEAAWGVVTTIGTNMTSGGQGTLVYIWKYHQNTWGQVKPKEENVYVLLVMFFFFFTFASHAIDITELVATAAVTLVGAVHVGTLLATWVAFTLIQVCRDKVWWWTTGRFIPLTFTR